MGVDIEIKQQYGLNLLYKAGLYKTIKIIAFTNVNIIQKNNYYY